MGEEWQTSRPSLILNQNKMKATKIIFALGALITANTFTSCSDDDENIVSTINNANTYSFYNGTTTSETFAKGADVSWLTQMENEGIKFYSTDGTETECITLLKSYDINAIRLRVWVNPADGYCNKEDLIIKARRASQAGMRIMIDFHYSDTWADPSAQSKPAAWADYSFDELIQAVADHTTDVLTSLKNINVTPEWVQIGNEVGDGMLWGDGRASTNSTQFAKLVTSGINAAKTVFPEIKTVIHVQNGWNYNTTSWMMNVLNTNNVDYDIMGVSLYPENTDAASIGTPTEIVAQTIDNIKALAIQYNKDMMVCEFGYSVNNPDKGYECLNKLISEATQSGVCTGVFYWEPESYNWNGYDKGAFGADYKPLHTLDAFKN